MNHPNLTLGLSNPTLPSSSSIISDDQCDLCTALRLSLRRRIRGSNGDRTRARGTNGLVGVIHSQDDVMRGGVVWMEICLLSMEKEEVEDNEDNEDSFWGEFLGG